MAKFPLYLLLLLGINNVQAACYAGSWDNGLPVYGSLFVDGGTTLAQCQATACQIYPNLPECPSACQIVTDTQTLTCPPNQSGQIIQSRIKTCPDNQWQAWQTTQNTCTPNPPSCQTSQQSQSLSCPTGYQGSITQARNSVCLTPYSQPQWNDWLVISNTCTKSLSNPTNISSPASPISPLNPSSVVNSPTTTPTINQQQSTQDSKDGLSALTVKSIATNERAQKDAEQKQTETNNLSNQNTQTARTIRNFMLSLKPSIVQPNVFPDLNIAQDLPNDIKMMQNIYMDLITNGSLFNPDQTEQLKRIASDAVELEQ